MQVASKKNVTTFNVLIHCLLLVDIIVFFNNINATRNSKYTNIFDLYHLYLILQ